MAGVDRIKAMLRGRRERRSLLRTLLPLYERRPVALKDPNDPVMIRHFSDSALHYWLSKATEPNSRISLESELRRREAWAAPAGRSTWIATAALIVSLAALIISTLKL